MKRLINPWPLTLTVDDGDGLVIAVAGTKWINAEVDDDILISR